MKHESIVAEGHVDLEREQIAALRLETDCEDRWAFTVLAVATVAHIGFVILIGKWILG